MTKDKTYDNEKLMTIHQMWKNNNIYWIGTYKTLLKYVSEDYKDIFQPIVKGQNSGKRYYIKKENIDKFVKMFENNELSA